MPRSTYRSEIRSIEDVTGVRKAAVLMVALRHDTAARIMRALDRERVEEVSREIAAIDAIAPEVREQVIREFYNLLMARQYMDAGGMSWARTLLMKTLPPEEARRIMSVIEHQVHEQPFSFLQKTEKENLVTFLQEEHPQTIALVLSHVPAGMAVDILSALPTERQIEVVARIANMDQTSPDVIKEVERGLEKRLAGLVSERFERVGGVEAVAEILNMSGRAVEKAILEGLEDDHPQLVEEIRRLMFVFEDIIRVNDKGIQSVLKEVENEELAMAMRTASDELKDKIFNNMSERAAQLIREEMEFMGPVRVSDVEAAQQKIVDIVRRLEDAGEVIIAGRGGEGELVV
ncbi:MAG: flagellar motor switch protein FliG [Phycisphaerales bacterium]|nr:flagellar motor switch protein FliG [Phycisphaerales bacterium]